MYSISHGKMLSTSISSVLFEEDSYAKEIRIRWCDVFVILLSGLVLMSVCGGVYYNYGTFYLLILKSQDIDPPTLALIGTSADIIFCFVMPYSVPYLKRAHGIKLGIFFGATLICGGLLMCSFIHELHIWFLTYSAVIGLGEGVLFMAVVEMIYSKSPTALRGFMMGFASGGMFLGISIFGPVLLALESWTDDLWNSIRILAAIFGASSVLALTVWTCFESHIPLNKRTARQTSLLNSDFAQDTPDSIFFWVKDLYFQLLFGSFLFVALGYIVPFVHLLKAAEIDGVKNLNSIPMAMGLAGFCGRVFFGIVADVLSRKFPKTAPNLNLFTFCVIACGIFQCIIPLANSQWTYNIVAGAYGFFGGGRMGLVTLMCGEVFGESLATIAYGFLCWSTIPQLLGPSAVAYMQRQLGNYTIGFISVGIITLLATTPLLYICVTIQQRLSRGENLYMKLAEAPE